MTKFTPIVIAAGCVLLGAGISDLSAAEYLIICSGQSNMGGVARPAQMPDELRPVPKNVVYYRGGGRDTDKLESQPTFDGSKGYGPTPRLAHDLAAARPNDCFIVLLNAVGGSALCQWVPDYAPKEVAQKYKWTIGNYYVPLAARLAVIRRLHPDAQPLAFLWLQGETDKFDDTAAIYLDNLKRLVANVRRDAGNADLLAVVAEPGTAHEGVYDALATFAKEDAHAALVKTRDINGGGKSLHFSDKSYNEIGKRYATAVLAQLK